MAGRSILIVAICIIGFSYGLFFYLQSLVEEEFRESLFEQERARQIQSTVAIGQHIASDLVSISSRLELAASADEIRSGDLSNQRAAAILDRTLMEIYHQNSRQRGASPMTDFIIDGLYLVDRNGIVTLDIRKEMNLQGSDISSRSYVSDTKTLREPVFSTGYRGNDGVLRIAATHPIIGTDGTYRGMVVATMPTLAFFQYYGNIYDIKSQYMAVLDNDAIQLVHPVASFVGTSFFGEHTQNATGHNEILNNQIRTVMSGVPSNSIYEFVNGERFNSGYPIFFRGEPVYFVFIITPTSAIYSTTDGILSTQRIETFTVLVGTTVSVGVLIFLLAKWNSGLNREVEARTREIRQSHDKLARVNSQLEDSNKQLSIANEKMKEINLQLERNERTQKEFINVAAHELRTPLQPILALAEVMRQKTTDPEMVQITDTIERNARRLLQLSSDILDAARIEGQGLGLKREYFELNDSLLRAVQENLAQFQSKNVRLSFEPGAKSIVYADKMRISQVISNLLSNAAKFTQEGTVRINATRSYNDVLVTINDSGSGIAEDLLPRLFTKFATKSEKGTGLGLYISKNIIEAHGGVIWAQNNLDGKGATFGFTLPLSEPKAVPMRVADPPLRAEN